MFSIRSYHHLVFLGQIQSTRTKKSQETKMENVGKHRFVVTSDARLEKFMKLHGVANDD